MFRFSVKGTNDSYICFAEEKTDDAKKITYVLGGWGNSTSTVKWMPKGQKGNHGWHGIPSDPYTYKGQVHKGAGAEAWFEVNWDILDPVLSNCMTISKISDRDGNNKEVMSKFPMRDVNPNWFMVTSGCNTTADWEILIPSEKTKSIQQQVEIPGELTTPPVNGHAFKWTNGVAGDISEV